MNGHWFSFLSQHRLHLLVTGDHLSPFLNPSSFSYIPPSVPQETVTTTFADVAGCDEAKKEIMEFVEFLKDSKRFTDLGKYS